MPSRKTRPDKSAQVTNVRTRLTKLAAGGAAAALLIGCSPAPAIAATGNTGTTKVTVQADENNLRFKVPTVIPFVAASDGTLTGPTSEALRIENLSVFGLKVTNVKVTPTNGWKHSNDTSAADDSINWMLGPTGAIVSATAANNEDGFSISSPQWNMTYQNNEVETDEIKLETAGSVGRVATDISAPVHVGTVTFTLAPGAHAAKEG